MLMSSMCSSFDPSKSRGFGQAPQGTECIGHVFDRPGSTKCSTADIQPKCPSRIDWNGVNMSMNSCWYFKHSSGITIDLRQSVVLFFWGAGIDDFLFVLMFSTTLGCDWSSWDRFCGALEQAKSDISFLRCLVTFFQMQLYCGDAGGQNNDWAVMLSLKAPSAARHPWSTRTESESKYGKPLDLAVAINSVTDMGSSGYCSATRNLFECLIFDLWLPFDLRGFLIFASCEICFVKTALAR